MIFRLDDCGNCKNCIDKIVYGVTEYNRCILKSKCLANNDLMTCNGEYEEARDKVKKEEDQTRHIVCSDSAGTFYIIES